VNFLEQYIPLINENRKKQAKSLFFFLDHLGKKNQNGIIFSNPPEDAENVRATPSMLIYTRREDTHT
jgi:hypothetical protein